MRLPFHWIEALVLTAAISAGGIAVAQESRYSARQIQQALVDSGYDLGNVDGIWGRRSTGALKAFQKARDLPQTGILDEATTAELFPPPDLARKPLPTTATDTNHLTVKEEFAPRKEVTPAATRETEARRDTVDEPHAPPLPPLEAQIEEVLKQRPSPPADATPASSKLGSPALDADKTDRTDASGGMTYLLLFGIAGVLLWLWKLRKRHADRQLAPANDVSQPTHTPVYRFANTVGEMNPVAAPNKSNSATASPESAAAIALQNVKATERLLEKHLGAKSGEKTVPNVIDRESLASHKANVVKFIQQRGPIPASDITKQYKAPDWLPPPQMNPVSARSSQALWVPANKRSIIGRHTIPGGMVYVGEYLPKLGNPREAENCLIDPRLPVANQGDAPGQTMGYWPSYATISSAARKSYLDWLSGSRSDPSTYIGYVFLYFYGLERRLMLEEDAADAGVVVAEVRRLLAIYGGNNSFKRYANELLSAHELKSAASIESFHLDVDENSYEVPIMLKAALGMRVRNGDAIEPDLLLAYVIAHPETRVRTPARRAQTVLRELFTEAVEKQYPNGVRVSAAGARKLKASYRACSGSFDVEILPFGGDLPDITNRKEPITSARRIFDDCSDRLDDYSRFLGRSQGLKPTFAAVAKLPVGSRLKNAEKLAGHPLSRLKELADSERPILVKDLALLAGMEPDKLSARAKQKELSGMLAAFGYGITADPSFWVRAAKPDETAIVFHLEGEARFDPEPGERYRPLQLSIMLGMVIAFSDGHLHPLEKRKLLDRIEQTPGLSMDERARLKAEIKVCETDAGRVAAWAKRIEDVSEASREHLADELVAIAVADGTLHAREVSQLEKLFRQMGLDDNSLYSRLHGKVSSDRDDDLPMVIPAGTVPLGSLIPPAPSKAPKSRVDFSRLDAIRRETRTTASVLADIFVEDEDTPAEAPLVVNEVYESDEGESFDGLERRYGLFLSELLRRESWAASDFEHLARAAGLMPGAAKQTLNDWSLDRFDEFVLEGDEPVVVNAGLFPERATLPQPFAMSVEGMSA